MAKDKANKGYTPSAARPDRLIRYATFRQLQIFESVYRLGSLTRAAEELFLTQPTVSMQLKKLGNAVEMPLFEPVGRSIEPTEAGHETYLAIRQVFDILSNLEMKFSDLQGMKRGRLRIAVITNAKYLVPEMLGDFSKLYPGIEFAMKVCNRDQIIERMYANEDDLYIMGQAPEGELETRSYMIAPNPLVAMAPKGHPLLKKKNISLQELSEEPFIMREPGSGTRDALIRLFKKEGLLPNVIMELGSNEAIKHAIVADLGISIMSLHTLTLEGAGGPVLILDVKDLPIMRNWYVVLPKKKELSLAAQTFLDFAIEYEPKIRKVFTDHWPSLKEYL